MHLAPPGERRGFLANKHEKARIKRAFSQSSDQKRKTSTSVRTGAAMGIFGGCGSLALAG